MTPMPRPELKKAAYPENQRKKQEKRRPPRPRNAKGRRWGPGAGVVGFFV